MRRTKKKENKRDNYICNAKTIPLWHLLLAEHRLQHALILKFQLRLLRKKSRPQPHYSCFWTLALFSRVWNGPREPRSSLKAGSRSVKEFFFSFYTSSGALASKVAQVQDKKLRRSQEGDGGAECLLPARYGHAQVPLQIFPAGAGGTSGSMQGKLVHFVNDFAFMWGWWFFSFAGGFFSFCTRLLGFLSWRALANVPMAFLLHSQEHSKASFLILAKLFSTKRQKCWCTMKRIRRQAVWFLREWLAVRATQTFMSRKIRQKVVDTSVKTETGNFERKRQSTFLFFVHNFTAADRLNPASPSGKQQHGGCSVRRQQWERTGKVHQSSGSLRDCCFLCRPAEGAVTSHSCCLAPSWELREFWLCGGPPWWGGRRPKTWLMCHCETFFFDM